MKRWVYHDNEWKARMERELYGMNQGAVMDQDKIEKVLNNIHQVIVGKREIALLSFVALLAQGHILLEDVPGVGKTMLVRSLAKSIDCEFKRIQFTPDLLPSDITGTSIYHPKNFDFEFRPGPIFGHVVLADEINRTSPKTQSALLEGMEEKSVTIDGLTTPLKTPFFVMATQNPIEHEGTYPLPEAQLDRFLLKLKMGYPSLEEEVRILENTVKGHPIEQIHPVMSKEDVVAMQQRVQTVYVANVIQQYIVQMISQTREHPAIFLGVSPRGSIALMKASQAFAYVQGRDFVIPDDVKFLAPYVLAHRLILTREAVYDRKNRTELIDEIIKEVKVPVDKEYRK